ncbi:hypothetical protein MKEN_01048200 [Mycena kentingensis (nom. inval.)]|nr:hypothetical protein MKEN_01048200 [Mycena kentingensis (nom. inval.)]
MPKIESSPTQARPSASTPHPTRPDGLIYKSHALKQYKAAGLREAHLAQLVPVRDEPNPRNPATRVKLYDAAQIEALVERVKDTPTPTRKPATEPNAPKKEAKLKPYEYKPRADGLLFRKNAMKHYRLREADLDTLTPVHEGPNPRNPATVTKLYNEKEVQELAARVQADAAANPRQGWIFRSKALKAYPTLGDADLDALVPVHEGPNPWNVTMRVRMYDEKEVQALVERKREAVVVKAAPRVRERERKPKPKQKPAPEPLVFRSHAMQVYNLGETDLTGLVPRLDEPWPMNPTRRLQQYSEREVRELVERLKNTTAVKQDLDLTGFAAPRGVEIFHLDAIKEFNLAPCQLTRIKPVRVAPNPNPNAKLPLRYYNRCDVLALNEFIAGGARKTACPTVSVKKELEG